MKMNRMFEHVAPVLIAMVFVGVLGSCGSGAVTAPEPTSFPTMSVSPAVAEVYPDVPTTFTIGGGKPPYNTFSGNSTALPLSSIVNGSTFTVVANAVAADTTVDITIRDAVNTPVTAKANIHPSTLINQITFTPLGPNGTGCGTGICSGGDAQVIVKAVLNGIVLRARPIRFEVYQGNFQIVTPGSGLLVNSLLVNTDEQGEAVVRITTPASVPTQTATLQSTDTTTGLARRYNFNIIQLTSGVGVLSVLPSSTITIKGAKGDPGKDGSCPNTRVDFYVYGGTPPYSIVSPFPLIASPLVASVPSSGSGFPVLVNGCGKVSLIITDSKGLTIETPLIDAQQGDRGDTTTATTLTVAPTTVTVGCGQTASVNLVGSGTFTQTIVTAGVNGANFTVSASPSSGVLPATVSFTRSNFGTVPTPVIVNLTAGSTVTPVTVTVTGGVGSTASQSVCP